MSKKRAGACICKSCKSCWNISSKVRTSAALWASHVHTLNETTDLTVFEDKKRDQCVCCFTDDIGSCFWSNFAQQGYTWLLWPSDNITIELSKWFYYLHKSSLTYFMQLWARESGEWYVSTSMLCTGIDLRARLPLVWLTLCSHFALKKDILEILFALLDITP